MKRQKARIAVRKASRRTIEEWCKQNDLEANIKGVIAFDKAHPEYGLINHEKAESDGYALHVRMQAAAVIASWARVVVLKDVTGPVPSPESPFRKPVPVKVQHRYNNKRLDQMTEKELDNLIADFELYIRNKTVRVYYFLNLKNALKQNRGLVQDIMKKAEEDAYKQYAAA